MAGRGRRSGARGASLPPPRMQPPISPRPTAWAACGCAPTPGQSWRRAAPTCPLEMPNAGAAPFAPRAKQARKVADHPSQAGRPAPGKVKGAAPRQSMSCAAGSPSPQHFTGKFHDGDTGLDYFGARYYSPQLGPAQDRNGGRQRRQCGRLAAAAGQSKSSRQENTVNSAPMTIKHLENAFRHLSVTALLLIVLTASAASCRGQRTAKPAPSATANVADQAVPCDRAAHLREERDADHLSTWASLYKFYQTYKNCSFDADAGEGVSDATARLLVDHWNQFPVQLANRDPGFGQFIVCGVNGTDLPKDLRAILANSMKKCPAGANALCTQLSQYATVALDEQQQSSGAAPAPCCSGTSGKRAEKAGRCQPTC